MDMYRACVAAHLFLGIVLVGQALFWLTMLAALRQRYDVAETDRLLGIVRGARWPHVAVPYRLRLALPWVGWLTIIALAVTGVAAARLRGAEPAGTLWTIKQGLTLAILALQVLLTRRPGAFAIRANFYVVLATVVVSAWMIR